jgi:hypothetical protein
MAKIAAILGALSLLGFGFAAERKPTVADGFKNVHILAIPANGRPVDRTVADEFRRDSEEGGRSGQKENHRSLNSHDRLPDLRILRAAKKITGGVDSLPGRG